MTPPLQKPSSEYSAFLEPQKGLRRLVLCGGTLLNLAGAWALLVLPLSADTRVLLVAGWLAWGAAELAACQRRFARAQGFLLDATGSIRITPASAGDATASVLPGSVVLRSAIWLRYRLPDGRSGAELFLGDSREDAEFRRAAVLLRLPPEGQNH